MRGATAALAIAVVACLAIGVCDAKAIIPYAYPLYKQCDPAWGSNQMGTNASCNACGEQPATVCEQGCAMSCVSMAMNGAGVRVPKPDGTGFVDSNPGTMNAWLHASSGFWCAWGDCNNLMLTAPNRLSNQQINVSFVSENEKPQLPVLQMWLLTGGYMPIAHVRNKTHFVLVTGWDDAVETTLYVNDPGFSQLTYDYNDVADILLYTVLPANSNPAPAVKPDQSSRYDGPTTGWLSRARQWISGDGEDQ